jgi:hypothetical protein
MAKQEKQYDDFLLNAAKGMQDFFQLPFLDEKEVDKESEEEKEEVDDDGAKDYY